jgi:hypothetical protein
VCGWYDGHSLLLFVSNEMLGGIRVCIKRTHGIQHRWWSVLQLCEGKDTPSFLCTIGRCGLLD